MSEKMKSEVAKKLLAKLDDLEISDVDAICIELIISKKPEKDKVEVEDEEEEELDKDKEVKVEEEE